MKKLTTLKIVGFLIGLALTIFALRTWWFGAQEPFLLSEEATSAETLSGWVGYGHPSLPFAFAYPQDMTVSSFADGGAEIVLLRGKEPAREIQIVASAFDEPEPLTIERIKRDMPEMVVEEPQNALIGSAKIPALLFWSEGGSAGRTREVWFVRDGYLYQVTAPAEMDETLAKMMETWKGE